MTRVVLVDDEVNVIKALQRVLAREGWEVMAFTSAREALEQLVAMPMDLVISDYRMPEMNGVEFLQACKEEHPDALRIILSGQADIDGVMDAINNAEVYRFITKPWNNEELILTLRQALEFNRLKQENERLAATVRQQSNIMKKQLTELQRLEKESPGITQVDWNDDGSITLDEDELSDDIDGIY